jgi:hypothetical protein
VNAEIERAAKIQEKVAYENQFTPLTDKLTEIGKIM